MGKGADWERRFNNHLEGEGWSVFRAGGSGGGTSGNRPDMVVGNGTYGWVVEHKFSSDRNIYLEAHEVEQIRALAEDLHLEPVVVLRWNTNEISAAEVADWFPVSPGVAGRTPSGKYSFNVEKIQSRFPPLEDYLDSDSSDMG